MTMTLDRQPPAITVPGELWHLNGYALNYVIVDRPGVGPDGNHYRRSNGEFHHTLKVGEFATVRDAACAVQAHNAWSEICALDWENYTADSSGMLDDVREILARYGRA